MSRTVEVVIEVRATVEVEIDDEREARATAKQIERRVLSLVSRPLSSEFGAEVDGEAMSWDAAGDFSLEGGAR